MYTAQYTDEFNIFDKDKFYDEVIDTDDKKFEIFGYASLIWLPNFEFNKQVVGCVKNKATRMYQGSQRLGTAQWPGRVATLIHSAGNICFGHMYYISDRNLKIKAWKYLLGREIGYELVGVDFYTLSDDKCTILSDAESAAAFVAFPDNLEYLGECDITLQAYQIWKANNIWPNTLYVEKLHQFYKSIPSQLQVDDYVNDICSIIRRLSSEELTLSQDELNELPKLFKCNHLV